MKWQSYVIECSAGTIWAQSWRVRLDLDAEREESGLNRILKDLDVHCQMTPFIQTEFGPKWSVVSGSMIVGTVERVKTVSCAEDLK